MKHLFKMLVISVLLTSNAFAQTDPVRAELDHIFQYIDKSQVPSGYLDEYGPQFAEKKWYTGALADSNFIQFISGFRFLYNDIEQARIYSGAPVLASLDVINNTISQLPASNNTPLIFLIGKYATAKEDAINLNLFSNNGNNQVLDVPGRTQSPYIENNFFAACPVLEDAPQKNNISLSYNPALAYSNCGKIISSVAVDFLKGAGYQNIAPNAAVSYTYTDSSGYKRFAIRVNCTDGSVYYCYSQQFVIVTTVNNNINARYAPLTEAELANPVITIPAVAGEHFGAKVYIRYSIKRHGTALANQLVKPFIVVEGYDLNDVAPMIDKENYTINSLLEEWINIENYDLQEALDETAGYDLVFVNYFTMDYVENNAKMLEKVIDQLNALKVINEVGVREKNVVMGISFGGIISRYTLAKMTKNRGTNSTDTRLLLTYDSPHQGGNVPIGFQHFLYDFGELKIAGVKFKDASPELNEFYKLSSQPATSQLLLLRVSDANGTVHYNTFFADYGPYRTMVDFTSAQTTSTPPLYEFKAISQGSQCAKWVMQPGTILSTTSGNVATARWVAFGIVTVKYKLTVEVKALPQQGETSRISYVKMERNIRLFWGAIGTGWKTTGEQPRQSPVGLIPYDCVPGGTSSALQRSGGGINSNYTYPGAKDWYISNFWDGVVKPFFVVVSYSAISTNLSVPFQQDIFTTVPINSSLDLQNVSLATFNQSYIFPINGTAGSRAKTYIANESFTGSVNGVATTLFNYEHADFTKRQSQWMFNEMEGITQPFDCNDQCVVSSAYSINGDNTVCTTSNPYIIPYLPFGSTVKWRAIPDNIVTINSPTATQTTITAGYNGGIITLIATITNLCDQVASAYKYDISIGSGVSSLVGRYYLNGEGQAHDLITYYGGINYIPSNSGFCSVFIDNPGLESATWSLYSGYIGGWTQFTEGANPILLLFPPYGDPVTFRLSNTNTCGTYDFDVLFAGQSQYGYYSISPNPTTSTLTVSVDETKLSANKIAKSSDQDIKEIVILDKTGMVQLKQTYSIGTRQLNMNVSVLKPGVYIVRIFNGKKWTAMKLIKE